MGPTRTGCVSSTIKSIFMLANPAFNTTIQALYFGLKLYKKREEGFQHCSSKVQAEASFSAVSSNVSSSVVCSNSTCDGPLVLGIQRSVECHFLLGDMPQCLKHCTRCDPNSVAVRCTNWCQPHSTSLP